MDLINVMTYDLRGSWEGFTGEDSPLYAGPQDQGSYIYFNVVSGLIEMKGFHLLLCIIPSLSSLLNGPPSR